MSEEKAFCNQTDSSVPSLSVIVPVHNEEAILARVLTDALARSAEYPAAVEIIVACNGCSDGSGDTAKGFPVRVIESDEAGMSFGKNLGGREATNDLLLFWDADTWFDEGAFADFADAVRGRGSVTGGFFTLPDKVYPRSVVFYWMMNLFCKRRQLPPAGTVFVTRTLYEELGGFDETIPQGTSSDLGRRAVAAGADFVYVPTRTVRTSVRRFEKRGYIRQLLDWRRNIKHHSTGEKAEIAQHDYDVIR